MRYLGNKTKLLAQIEAAALARVGDGPRKLLDAFAGSAAVSRHFRSQGWTVQACDLLQASYVAQRAALGVVGTYPSLVGIRPRCGLLYRQFSTGGVMDRRYLTPGNAAQADGYWVEMVGWLRDGRIDTDTFHWLLYRLMCAVDRVANISGTYGAYLKEYTPSSCKPLKLILELPPVGPAGCAYRGDVLEIAEAFGQLAYLDPPYNRRQYSSNYHLLEILATMHTLGEEDLGQLEGTLVGKTGLPTGAPRSAYCSAATAADALIALLEKLRTPHLLISYSSEGILEIDQIESILEATDWDHHQFQQTPYARFRSHSRGGPRESNLVEYLIGASRS